MQLFVFATKFKVRGVPEKDYFSPSYIFKLFIFSGKKDLTVVLVGDQKVPVDRRKRLLEVEFNQVIDELKYMFVKWENISHR